MSVTLDRIAETLDDARSARVSQVDALRELAQLAEARGDRSGRRGAGAYFTADDVASWLVRRAIAPQLLEAAGATAMQVDRLLADGGSLPDAIASRARDGSQRARMRARIVALTVLDPTCGAGAFLIAAWRELEELQALLDDAAGGEPELPRITASQLAGIDVDADAVAACAAGLELVTGSTASHLRCCDALHGDALATVRPDVLVGNPPYVGARPGLAPAASACAEAGNLAAWIVERALAHAAPGARCGFVLPVAVACSGSWSRLRAQWSERCDAVWTSHFDTIPATLFPGVVQRLTMLEGRVRSPRSPGVESDHDAPHEPAAWWTTRYHRWKREERTGLLERVRFVSLPPVDLVPGSIAKVGTELEAGLLARLATHPRARRLVERTGSAAATGDNRLYYKRRWSYFLLFADFVPPIWDADGGERAPSECKVLDVVAGVDARALVAVYSSSLFWWYFSVFTDNRNVNRRELEGFPVPLLDAALARTLADLGSELMVELHACGEQRTCTYRSIGTIRNTYYRQGATRPVIDRIDAALADAYGMSAEELAFVVGFEHRFRS